MSDWCDELDVPAVTSPPMKSHEQPSSYNDTTFNSGHKEYNSGRNDYNQSHEASSNWRQNRPSRDDHQDSNYGAPFVSHRDDDRSNRSFPPRGRGRRGNSRQRGSWQQPHQNSNWHDRNDAGGTRNQDSRSSYQTNDGLIDWTRIESAAEEIEKELFGDLAPVKKITYQESEKIASLPPEQVNKFRKEKNSITLSSLDGSPLDKPFNPIQTFYDAFQPYPNIMKQIHNQGFKEPSPIQCQLWPILMWGYDAVGIAQTGTGKTLAYLLPGLLHIAIQSTFESKRRAGPLMLVLGPTRELVQQIHQEISKYSYKNMKSVCVYGQGSRHEQKRALLNMVEIVVATPGRLIDFVNSKVVDLKEVSYLVLDEADRMLDLGFQPDIIKVTSSIRRDRQTILTSATWPSEVEYIAKRLMKDPVKIQVGDLDLAAVSTVTQIVEVCEEDEKFGKLLEKLDDLTPIDKVLIFTNKKATADFLINFLLEANIDSRVMHGGLEQCDRESALADLKSGRCQVLCATDVASRGLDITDLTKVINLDLPKNLEEYVHRSGRTGRAGKSGLVISFVTWDNKLNATELIKILERSDQFVPDELRKLAERGQRFLEKRNQNRPRGQYRGRY